MIFKFEKCLKYANEMTDDVIYSTQYYIKYINRAIYLVKFAVETIKHLMTGHKGNSKFFFPETLNVEVEGKQNSLFSSSHPIGSICK